MAVAYSSSMCVCTAAIRIHVSFALPFVYLARSCWIRLILLWLTVMSFRLLELGVSCVVRGCLRVSVFGSVRPPHPQSFMCTMAEASLRQHAESKHPKSTFELCFPTYGNK